MLSLQYSKICLTVMLFTCFIFAGCASDSSKKSEVARKYMETGNYSKAMESWGEVIKIDPTDKSAHQQLIFCMIVGGSSENVEKYLSSYPFLTEDPEFIASGILEAARINLKKNLEFKIPIQIALKLKPNLAQKALIDDCETIIKSGPESNDLDLATIKTSLTCSGLLEQLNLPDYFLIADRFFEASQKNDNEKKIALLQEAARINPKYKKDLADYYIEKGNKTENPLEKISFFQLAAMSAPDDYGKSFFAQIYYEASKKFDESGKLALLEMAIGLDPAFIKYKAEFFFEKSKSTNNPQQKFDYLLAAAKDYPAGYNHTLNNYCIEWLKGKPREDRISFVKNYKGVLTNETIDTLVPQIGWVTIRKKTFTGIGYSGGADGKGGIEVLCNNIDVLPRQMIRVLGDAQVYDNEGYGPSPLFENKVTGNKCIGMRAAKDIKFTVEIVEKGELR